MSITLKPPGDRTQALVAAAHRGDPRAQRQLYDHFYPYARTIAIHYASGADEAEDIVQDAFIKLFNELYRRPFSGDFKKWFRRIVVNTGIDHFRAGKRRLGLLNRLATLPRSSTRNEAEHNLEATDVHRFLQQLSPAYRLVFNLYVIEGYRHHEIADLLGISEGTSKSNLAKARRKLQHLAAPYFNLENDNPHG